MSIWFWLCECLMTPDGAQQKNKTEINPREWTGRVNRRIKSLQGEQTAVKLESPVREAEPLITFWFLDLVLYYWTCPTSLKAEKKRERELLCKNKTVKKANRDYGWWT